MKIDLTLIGLVGIAALTACQQVGTGSAGKDSVSHGTDREDGSTPYAIGRTDASQRAGTADANIASGRAEAAMDVSGAGAGELARRSAAATVDPTSTRSDEAKPTGDEERGAEPVPPADQSLRERIQTALGAPAEPSSVELKPVPIETLNQVQVDVHKGTVTLRGRVNSTDESDRLDALVRRIDGVRKVSNQLRVNPATNP